MLAQLRRFAAILLALLAVAPGAAADPDPAAEDAQPEVCVQLSIGDSEDPGPSPEACSGPAENATRIVKALWESHSVEGEGKVVLLIGASSPAPKCNQDVGPSQTACKLELYSSEVELVPESFAGALARVVDVALSWGAESAQQMPIVPAPSNASPEWIVVVVEFHVRWSMARCDDARGEVAATVGSVAVPVAAPPGFFAALCALSQESLDLPRHAAGERSFARIAASALAQVREAPGQAALASDFDAAIGALETIALPPLAPDAPSIEPPERDASADGEAILRAAPKRWRTRPSRRGTSRSKRTPR